MIILFGIILMHISVIYLARYFSHIGKGGSMYLFFISMLIAIWVLVGMLFMEKPDTLDGF